METVTHTIARLKESLKSRRFDSVHVDLVLFKNQSRQLHEQAFTAKEQVSRLKRESDASHLALQSVNYERHHLEKELPASLSTRTFDTLEFAESDPQDAPHTMRETMERKLKRVKREVEMRKSWFSTSFGVSLATDSSQLSLSKWRVSMLSTTR